MNYRPRERLWVARIVWEKTVPTGLHATPLWRWYFELVKSHWTPQSYSPMTSPRSLVADCPWAFLSQTARDGSSELAVEGCWPHLRHDNTVNLDSLPQLHRLLLFELIRNLHRGADFFHCGLGYCPAFAGAFSYYFVDLFGIVAVVVAAVADWG